jgi:RNA polymerase-binding transcription factor DksA
MKIKVKTTPEQRKLIKEQLERYKDSLCSLKEEYLREVEETKARISEYKKFWETNEMSIYESDYNRPYDKKRLCKARAVYKEMGLNINTMEPWSLWCCSECGQEIKKKYIATGHDHTDYSYDVCDCDGVQKNKRWEELN